VIQSNDNNNN